MRIVLFGFLTLAGLNGLAFQFVSGSIKGTVIDLEDNPVPEVTLTFTSASDPGSDNFVVTKENGRYIMRLPEGDVTLRATKEGYRSRTLEYTQRLEDMKINFRMVREDLSAESLGPGPRIFGILKDSNGEPVEGMELTLTTEMFPDLKRVATTNKLGGFKLEGIKKVDFRLHVRKEGYRDVIHIFTQGEAPTEINDLKIQTLEEAYKELGIEPPKIKLTPEDMAIDLYNSAVEPYQTENWPEAERLAKEAVDMDPKQYAALKMLVYTNMRLDDWGEVMSFANKYLELKPEDPGIIQIALQAANKIGRTEEAEKLTGRLMKMGVITPDSLFNSGVDALNADDDEKAKAIMEEVIKTDPKYARAYYELGMILIREGEFEAAINQLKLFLKHAPADNELREEATDLIVTLSE